jgi:hypothetical protein
MSNSKSELIKTASLDSNRQAGLLLNELTYQQLNMRKDLYHYNNFFNLYNQYLINPQLTNTLYQAESAKKQQRTIKNNNSFHINQILPELFDQETVPIKNQVGFFVNSIDFDIVDFNIFIFCQLPKTEPQSLLKISSSTKASVNSSNLHVNTYLQEFLRNQQMANVKLPHSFPIKFNEEVESNSIAPSKTKKRSTILDNSSIKKEEVYSSLFLNANITKKSTPSSVNKLKATFKFH